MIVDPAFYYYLDRSAQSIVDELTANGYYDVRLACINESGISDSLVKAFAGSGVKVWMLTFTNGTYSTADLPAGWESWQMVLRKPYTGFTYLCPNNPNYRAWKKTQVTNALLAHPFYGIDFGEPFFPGTYGPSSNYYGCMCSYCADGFRAMYPGVDGPPDFENPASPHYYKTDTVLYQKWIDFRVASVNGFLDYLINGAGGVRERCPKVRIATWSLGLNTSDQLAKLREYYGFDAAAMVQLIRPGRPHDPDRLAGLEQAQPAHQLRPGLQPRGGLHPRRLAPDADDPAGGHRLKHPIAANPRLDCRARTHARSRSAFAVLRATSTTWGSTCTPSPRTLSARRGTPARSRSSSRSGSPRVRNEPRQLPGELRHDKLRVVGREHGAADGHRRSGARGDHHLGHLRR